MIKRVLLTGALLWASASVAAPYDMVKIEAQERADLLSEIKGYIHSQSMDFRGLLAIAEDDMEAAWLVSQMYARGIYFDENGEKAEHFARMAAESGSSDAQDYLSRHPGLTLAEQLYWANKSAAANHPKSLFYLGKAYFEGSGVERDIDLAMFYLARSENVGFEPAKRLRQDILDHQITQDSFEDILDNARSGRIDSLRRLAEAYREGILIDRDIEKAVRIDRQIDFLVQHEENHRVNGYN